MHNELSIRPLNINHIFWIVGTYTETQIGMTERWNTLPDVIPWCPSTPCHVYYITLSKFIEKHIMLSCFIHHRSIHSNVCDDVLLDFDALVEVQSGLGSLYMLLYLYIPVFVTTCCWTLMLW